MRHHRRSRNPTAQAMTDNIQTRLRPLPLADEMQRLLLEQRLAAARRTIEPNDAARRYADADRPVPAPRKPAI
jgi:hypothetical protein